MKSELKKYVADLSARFGQQSEARRDSEAGAPAPTTPPIGVPSIGVPSIGSPSALIRQEGEACGAGRRVKEN